MSIRSSAQKIPVLLSLSLLAAHPAAAQNAPTGNVFNPNISVIGNALGIVGHNEVDNQPSLRLKGAFGKLNTEHAHVRFFADVPLNMTNLLGGDDGIEDAGIAVSRLIPMPSEIFLEATAQLFRGTSENLFEAHTRNDLEPLFHLKAYRDLSEDANLELGGSWTRANNLEGPGFHTALTGIDATFRWKPLRQGLYRSVLVRTEWMLSERETPAGTVRADGYGATATTSLEAPSPRRSSSSSSSSPSARTAHTRSEHERQIAHEDEE
jgi:hypothetical protein